MPGMTFPTVIETPLHMESVTRDTFGDVSPAATESAPQTDPGQPGTVIGAFDRRSR